MALLASLPSPPEKKFSLKQGLQNKTKSKKKQKQKQRKTRIKSLTTSKCRKNPNHKKQTNKQKTCRCKGIFTHKEVYIRFLISRRPHGLRIGKENLYTEKKVLWSRNCIYCLVKEVSQKMLFGHLHQIKSPLSLASSGYSSFQGGSLMCLQL